HLAGPRRERALDLVEARLEPVEVRDHGGDRGAHLVEFARAEHRHAGDEAVALEPRHLRRAEPEPAHGGQSACRGPGRSAKPSFSRSTAKNCCGPGDRWRKRNGAGRSTARPPIGTWTCTWPSTWNHA